MIGRTLTREAVAAVAVSALLLLPAVAPAQIADTTRPAVDSVVITPGADPAVVDAEVERTLPISPGQAFRRSMLVPGWGQAEYGAYVRGGIYFAGWATNLFMIARTQARLESARGRYDLLVERLRRSLIAQAEKPVAEAARLEDPREMLRAVRADERTGGANDIRKLVSAREQQREDWIAWSIFWLLASGVDGFVTGHLADFPADIEVRPTVEGGDGSGALSLGVRVPFGGPPDRSARP